MIVAPAGMARFGPTALILSPSMTMTWLAAAVPVSGSISRPAFTAVILGALAGCCPSATPAIRTHARRHDTPTRLAIASLLLRLLTRQSPLVTREHPRHSPL